MVGIISVVCVKAEAEEIVDDLALNTTFNNQTAA
jgi:hypothetical protein